MSYRVPDPTVWQGRKTGHSAYLHEKVVCTPIGELEKANGKAYALLGYASDEGVRRNLGRIGASVGPLEIRSRLAKLANHLQRSTQLYDAGDIACEGTNLENSQHELSRAVARILALGTFPVLLGGGHEIAYGHILGVWKYLQDQGKEASLGIINLDAHFDLRTFEGRSTSGTPFYQVAQKFKEAGTPFHYFCLGIEPLSNSAALYDTANELNARYIENTDFHLGNIDEVTETLKAFAQQVDHLYLTIDMDGFSAAFAPGVSAPSPLGFEPRMAMEVIRFIIQTGKLISTDIAELNPKYDVDGRTARLAAQLVAQIILLLDRD